MAKAYRTRPIPHESVGEAQGARRSGEAAFAWSRAKIRVVGFVLLGAATPAAAGFSVPIPFVKWLCLAWLLGVVVLVHALSRRASAGGAVLTIDQNGILDRRLMPRRIAWQEIAAIWPVNIERAQTVDIELRWPETTLRGTRWAVRSGAYCQAACGVPAISISTLLLDASVSDVLDAIARYRPDLLHHTNRQTPLAAR